MTTIKLSNSVDEGKVGEGLLTADQVRRVEREAWWTPVRGASRMANPKSREAAVNRSSPDTPLLDLLRAS
jgi:hypothetical protein